MAAEFELNAETRADLGKGASRRLRRLADLIPAIIYGGAKDPQPSSDLAQRSGESAWRTRHSFHTF